MLSPPGAPTLLPFPRRRRRRSPRCLYTQGTPIRRSSRSVNSAPRDRPGNDGQGTRTNPLRQEQGSQISPARQPQFCCPDPRHHQQGSNLFLKSRQSLLLQNPLCPPHFLHAIEADPLHVGQYCRTVEDPQHAGQRSRIMPDTVTPTALAVGALNATPTVTVRTPTPNRHGDILTLWSARRPHNIISSALGHRYCANGGSQRKDRGATPKRTLKSNMRLVVRP